jgi:hypothetical protein
VCHVHPLPHAHEWDLLALGMRRSAFRTPSISAAACPRPPCSESSSAGARAGSPASVSGKVCLTRGIPAREERTNPIPIAHHMHLIDNDAGQLRKSPILHHSACVERMYVELSCLSGASSCLCADLFTSALAFSMVQTIISVLLSISEPPITCSFYARMSVAMHSRVVETTFFGVKFLNAEFSLPCLQCSSRS